MSADGHCTTDACTCEGEFRDTLISYVENGRIFGNRPSAHENSDYVLKQLPHLHLT